MNDRTRLVGILTGVYSFYRTDLTEFQLSAWLRVLDGVDVERIAKAFDAHLMDPSAGQFLPKPADLVRQLQGTQTDRAALAWSKALQAIQRVGAYASVVFDEPAIHCAVEDLGGWPALCATTYDELPHVERRFCAAYRAHLKGGTAHPPRLPGLAEQHNAIGGHASQPPELIGDEAAARAVMAGGTHRPRIASSPIASLAGLLPAQPETRT